MSHRWLLYCFLTLVFSLPGIPAGASAGEVRALPEREIVAAFEYPGRVVDDDTSVSLDLIIKNNGRRDETVYLDIVKKPENWEASIEHYSDVVTAVFVASGEKKTLTLSTDLQGRKRDETLPPGEYHFEVSAATADKELTTTAVADLVVRAKEAEGEEQEEEEKPVRITTSYPALRGPTDSEFEFSIDVHNETDEDDMFSLRADKPKGWEVAFKPSYENKYIGSFQIKSNLSQSIEVEVTPAPKAEAGDYSIKVYANSSKGEDEIELTVTLTGTHEIACKTLNGILSLTARKGKEANISMYVINEGSSEQREITFNSFKPENWEVTFEPETLDALAPGAMEQVEIQIKPAPEALVGDYSVAVSARGEDASDEIELRVTVKASTTWGWIGIAVIVAVVVGLGITFKRLGRR